MLYSGHKESGLIRISLSIGLGGPGWARGLYMDRKAGRPGTASLLKMEYAPASLPRTLTRRPGFLSIQCRAVEQAELSGNLLWERGRYWEPHSAECLPNHAAYVLWGAPCVQHDPAGN